MPKGFEKQLGVKDMLKKTLIGCIISAIGCMTAIAAILDFNGDGATDLAVIRGDGGSATPIQWWVSADRGISAFWGGVHFGLFNSDTAVPCDYDGDGKTDIAYWRPVSTGQPSGNAFFVILPSSGAPQRTEDFGQQLDDPRVVGDYDGDGKCDVAVYRRGTPSTNTQSVWYYRGSLNNPNGDITVIPWGMFTGVINDRPVPGDFDGDGKNDITIVRDPGGGAQLQFWSIQTTAGFKLVSFGSQGDIVVPGDYDGDGKTDIAITRNTSGPPPPPPAPPPTGWKEWWNLESSTGNIRYERFGLPSDIATHGDYDGDGKTDVSVMRTFTALGEPTVFWYKSSANGSIQSVAWGVQRFAGDYPLVPSF